MVYVGRIKSCDLERYIPSRISQKNNYISHIFGEKITPLCIVGNTHVRYGNTAVSLLRVLEKTFLET